MSIKAICLVICLLFGLSASLNIIPDINNSLMMRTPLLSTTNNQIDIRFSFPSSTLNQVGPYANGSSGLTYKQFIGVTFPPSVGTDMTFDQGASPKWSCSLTDGTYTYTMTAVQPVASPIVTTLTAETSTVYCRLDDNSANVPLKTGPSYQYRLTITVPTWKISINLLRSVSLFTSTSNNPEKVIIDSIPVIGSLAAYADWTAYSPKALEVTNTAITVTQGPSSSNAGTTIYPYNTFDITLSLKVNSFITAADHMIVFKFPSDAVSAATSVTTDVAAANDTLQVALKGTLALKAFGTDSVMLDGVTEDLIPNRQFKLNLKGWKSLDTDIASNLSLITYVYYKNTYSVLSYFENKIITITSSTITLTANHPEFWEVYRSGAWPIAFTFKSNNDLTNGGWVVIQHTNAQEPGTGVGNKLTFIASTCDFSGNDSTFDNSYGKRPNCYPLNNFNNYPSTTGTYNGSGIFFFFKGTMTANKVYKVTVWAFFDVCGGSDTASFNVVAGTTSSSVPKFTMNVYKYLNPTVLDEARFSTMQTGISKNQVLAVSSATDFNGKCWNTYINTSDAAIGTLRNDAALNTITKTDDSKVGVLFYKEVFDWHIFAATADFPTTPAVFTDLSASGAVLPTSDYKYFFSTSNALTAGSYFLTGFKIAGTNATPKLYQKLPLPVNTVSSATKLLPGKIIYQFPYQWFTSGLGYKGSSLKCYASWGAGSTLPAIGVGAAAAGTNIKNAKKVLHTESSGKVPMDATGKNLFGANTDSTAQANSIDGTLSILPPDNGTSGPTSSNIVRLVSTYTKGDDSETNEILYMVDYDAAFVANEDLYVGFFTNCVKWVSTAPTISSLYTYIDIQIKYNYIKTTGTTTAIGQTISAMRLIKLFPEAGVFNDFSKGTTTSTVNPFINHALYVDPTADYSVCLLELTSEITSTFKDAQANTLAVWLFYGTLLETDYNDQSATYPAAPLLSSVQAYGLSSSPMDWSNGYLSTGNTNFTPLLSMFVSLNTSQSLSAATDKPIHDNATSYIFFMGSLLLFTSVTTSNLTATTETTLYIPYYCPKFNSGMLGTTVAKAVPYPTVIAAWLNTSAFNTIGTLYKYVAYKDNDSSVSTKPTYTLLGSRFVSSGTHNVIRDFGSTTVANRATTAILKWTPYTDTTNQYLYVYNGTASAAGTAVFCTGHSLFLSSIITLDSAVTTSFVAGFTGSIGVFNGTKLFYVFGKPFNKAVLYGLNGSAAPSTASIAGTAGNSTTAPTNYYNGIKRPTVDTFVNGSNLTLTDRVAYSCATANKDKLAGLTNNIYESTNKRNNFILDWYPKTTGADWLSPSVAFDKNDSVKNDPAGNFKVVLSPPVAIPANAILKFTANNSAITTNTICGLIVTTGGLVRDCSTSSGTVSCTIPSGGSTFTVCCYNALINTDTFSLATVIANFPADSSITGLNTFLSGDIYSAASQIGGATNPFSFSTNNASATDIIGTKGATVSAISYSQVNQEGGFGKVTFTVTLPREATRNMRLSFAGDLSGMLVTGNSPRCQASFGKDSVFGSSWDSGDFLIDTCSFSSSSQTPIVITTKSLVYKCGLSFSKSLYVSLWPIVVVNWTNASNKSFKISMQLNGTDNIALGTQSFDMTLATQVATKPAASAQYDTLCAVSSVTPKIPGDLGDYTFDFDLDTAKANLANTNPNEVTIFWPYQQFGAFIPNILCLYNNAVVNCSFTDEGILNVRFTTNLPIGSGKKVQITVVGVTNPAMDADYSFPCTVNNSNFSTNARTNLIVGSGKLTGGINTSSVTSSGSLRFLSVSAPVSDKNPRNTSSHRFRIAFDNAIGLTASPVTIANTPVIHVYFPSNYRLGLYTTKPTATIDEYSNDANNAITKTNTYTPQSVVASGNRVTITLTQASVTFAATWRYWDINISNVVNPAESTIQTGPPATQTTRSYSVTLTNSNLTSLFRTYTNVNTYASDALTTPLDAWLGWNRGNSFTFDNSKYVVDVYAVATQLNVLTVKPGRFLQAFFNVKANSNNALAPDTTTMSLTDTTFKTSVANYSLSSSSYQASGFYIGCPCGTAPGIYIINFTSSNTSFFAPLSPVAVTVDNSSKAVISVQTPSSVPAGGSTFVSILLSEPNFDQLTITWSNADTVKNDESAKVSTANISAGTVTPNPLPAGQVSPVYSIFSIGSTSTTLAAQSFKTSDPNSCYTWNGLNTVSISISGTAPDVSTVNFTSAFKYFNAASDTTVAKNAIKFTFTPISTAIPVYIYCALACINQPYPADADIITPKALNSNLLQFYSNIITSTTSIDIVFSNLVRGQTYHMKCIIQSTQSDSNLRKSSNAVFENFVVTSGTNTTTVNIAPVATQATQCAQFQFLADPGESTRKSIINYCQRVFAAPGWSSNGCVICTNSDMSYVPTGFSFPQNITCVASTSKTRLRFLQTSTPTTPTTTTNTTTPSTLTVCPVPSTLCATDATAGGKTYADYFNQFTGDLKTAALIKTNLNIDAVSLNTTTPILTVTDSVAPDITKVVGNMVSNLQTGAASFTLTNPSPIVCFWQFSDSATLPTYEALSACNDPSWCGKTRVGPTTVTVNTGSPLKPFTLGTTYNVYIGCTNDIPMAQKVSAVKSIGSFNIPKPADNNTNNTNSNTTTPTTSANFLNISMFALLLILSLLFN